MLIEIRSLMSIFLFNFCGKTIRGPDLPMGVRVGTAHFRPFVFENLHPTVFATKVLELLLPGFNQLSDLLQFEFRDGLSMIRRKTNDPGNSTDFLRSEESLLIIIWFFFSIRKIQQCGKIIFEHISSGIFGVGFSFRTGISWTEITIRIVFRKLL